MAAVGLPSVPQADDSLRIEYVPAWKVIYDALLGGDATAWAMLITTALFVVVLAVGARVANKMAQDD